MLNTKEKTEKRLELIKEEIFLGIKCDFYKDDDDNIYMTREQIGEALQYASPRESVQNLHRRNADRLDNLSTETEMTSVEGKRKVKRKKRIYIEKGVYELCRFSRQPVANDFYDWAHEQIQLIRKTGGTVVEGKEEVFLDHYFPSLSEETKLMMIKDLHESTKRQLEKIKELEPIVENWSTFMDSRGDITISVLAKSLGIKGVGRNKLFRILREKRILTNNNVPYQRFLDGEYFKIINGSKNGIKFVQTLVTGKGMSWVREKMKDWGYDEALVNSEQLKFM